MSAAVSPSRLSQLRIVPTPFFHPAASQADYYRYLAEFAEGDQKTDNSQNANDAYQKATTKAVGLAPTHPIRLGLALNYSVFLYEVQGDQTEACSLAKQVTHTEHLHSFPPMSLPIKCLTSTDMSYIEGF